jgi:glutamine synthetase
MSEGKKITYADLEELLKDDNKVKVGGKSNVRYRKVWFAILTFVFLCSMFPGVDVDGVIRGKYVSKKKFMSSAKPDADFGFCSVVLWARWSACKPPHREFYSLNHLNTWHS